MAENNKPEEEPFFLTLLPHTDSAINNDSAMSQLRDSLLSQLTQLNPSLTPSTLTDRSSFIQSRLQQLFHSFRTPTHPPYALMINKAITELKDKIGSTEEAISEFVKREYEDLPWAHGKILSLHLKRLCEAGEIVCNENGRYVFPIGGVEEKERRKCGRKRKRGGNRRGNRGGDVERGMNLVSVGSDETSTRVCQSDHYSIGNVEEQTQVQMVKNLSPADGEEEKERGKGSRKRKRGNTRSSRGDGESGNQLCWLDSAGTDEPSTQVSESDHSIGSVEEQTQIQPEEGIVEHTELEETQIQMVRSEICAEGSPECIISTGPGIESSSPTQVPHQISTDIDTGITTALVCANGDDDERPQDYNEGNTNGNSDENPMSDSDGLEEMQPKRKRGRPRKSESDSNCQEKPLLLKRGATKNKMKKEQNGQTRGRGRPRKVNQDTEQCEEELKESEERKEEEKSRKKEEKLKKKEEKLDQAKLCGGEKKLKIKDQAKLRGQGRGRGRGRGQGRPKVCDAIAEAPASEDQAKLRGRGRGRGRGRPPKAKV